METVDGSRRTIIDKDYVIQNLYKELKKIWMVLERKMRNAEKNICFFVRKVKKP